MNNKSDQKIWPYCLVASFSDGTRKYFYGNDENEAYNKITDDCSAHGDVTWYDGATNLEYERGKHYTLCQPTEIIIYMGEIDPSKFS